MTRAAALFQRRKKKWSKPNSPLRTTEAELKANLNINVNNTKDLAVKERFFSFIVSFFSSSWLLDFWIPSSFSPVILLIMVLELHVWGPAFGLPSIDPQCLATIAYFSLAIGSNNGGSDKWVLVADSDPGRVPTRKISHSKYFIQTLSFISSAWAPW